MHNIITIKMLHKEKSFFAKNRKEWRTWLTKNADTNSHIWLILYHKNAATPSLTYEEAIRRRSLFSLDRW
jgi:uncharacterized protein YdeI (YjbR/CyaY-like superfamily)